MSDILNVAENKIEQEIKSIGQAVKGDIEMTKTAMSSELSQLKQKEKDWASVVWNTWPTGIRVIHPE